MQQVTMVPYIVEAKVSYNSEIIKFISENEIHSETDVYIGESKDSVNKMLELEGESGIFHRVDKSMFTLQNSVDYPNIESKNIKCSRILSFKPLEDGRFIFVISFKQGKMVNSITEAFKDQVKVIEECSLAEIDNIIRDIMINNEDMNRFNLSNAKFDVYSHEYEVKELHGLCTVSGQEVWFTIRCFKCN